MEQKFNSKINQKADCIVSLEEISTADVTLLDEYLLNAEKNDIDYLLQLEPERFLYNWYRTSGIKPEKEGYENSWERTNDKNFRGHMFGHYLSALAQAYRAEKRKTVRDQLLSKIKSCVNGIITCQRAYAQLYPERAGYASPFSEYWLNELDHVDSGIEAWNQKETDNPSTYVPWYNLHKVVAGLVDISKYVRDDVIGEAAFGCVQDFVDYVYTCRVSKYDETQKANMLHTEYGAMAEALYELYRLTGKASYKECAEGFMETPLFEALAAGKDVLSGKHANTTIPKFIGALKKYTVLSQNEKYYSTLTKEERNTLPMYRTAAEHFFDIVLTGHSFVTGGNSVAEHFKDADTMSSFYTHAETHETCNEYNMLKLARELFRLTCDKKYADYYERAFINAILASQNPQTGEMTYFQPMSAGYSKVFSKERFWCCTGTGIENFTKLGDSIYFKKDGRMYLNLYFSSELQNKERNLILTTQANLPNSEDIKVTIQAIDGGNVAEGTDLYLRVPDWCAGTPTVAYNHTKLTDFVLSGGYIVIEHIQSGDVIHLTFPMEVTVKPLKDNDTIVSFQYGPAVLAARLGQRNVGQCEPTGIMVLRAVQDTSLPTSILLCESSVKEWTAHIKKNLVRIEDTADGFVQFKAKDTYLDDEITFVPYYSIYDCRYGLYMNLAALDSPEMIEKILSDKKMLRNEEAASASLMQIDGNNYEATYHIQKSENSTVGTYNGRNYRDAQKHGWFSYTMPISEGAENYLNTVYTAADNQRSFEILINEEHFAIETISSDKAASSDGFYTQTRAIPTKYTEGECVQYREIRGALTPCVTVKFKSTGELVGGVYGISITQDFNANPNLSALSFDVGTLSPEFHPDIKQYRLLVPEEMDCITMQATPAKASGLVYDGTILIDDTQPRTIYLSTKKTVLHLIVYAQNHETNTQYTVEMISGRADS